MSSDQQNWSHNLRLALIALICACLTAGSTIALGRFVFSQGAEPNAPQLAKSGAAYR